MTETRRTRRIEPDDPIHCYFERARPVSELLPIEFDDGTILETLDGGCLDCGGDPVPEEVRGELFADGPLSYRLEVVQLCRPCRTLAHNIYQLTPTAIADVTSLYPDRFVRKPNNP